MVYNLYEIIIIANYGREDSGDMKIIILTSTLVLCNAAVLNLLTNIFLPAFVTTESCVII